MMTSRPSSHNMLGGNMGAITFLKHFLDQLDFTKNDTKLPLITAPVLVAFLTTAGHMLARKFPNEFQPLLDMISNQVLPKLDEGTFGAPSSVRLKKLVDGGYQTFETTLPEGAIPDLYSGGLQTQQSSTTNTLTDTIVVGDKNAKDTSNEKIYPNPSPFSQSNPTDSLHTFPQSNTTNSSNPFSQSNQTDSSNTFPQSNPANFSIAHPFGPFSANGFKSNIENTKPVENMDSDTMNQTAFNASNEIRKDNRPKCKFFAKGTCRNGDKCKFSHSMDSNSIPTNNKSSNNNPFGTFGTSNNSFATQINPFGKSNNSSNATPFGKADNSAPSTSGIFSNPFNTSSTSATSFSGSKGNNNNPFGSFGVSNPTGQNESPFGMPKQNAFGNSSGQSVVQSPFGTFGQMKASPSPFG